MQDHECDDVLTRRKLIFKWSTITDYIAGKWSNHRQGAYEQTSWSGPRNGINVKNVKLFQHAGTITSFGIRKY